MLAGDIDEVLVRLDSIIDESITTSNRAGLFAALYRQVTAAVKHGIADGAFDDGDRMNRLDTIFANRYLAALDAWRRGEPPPRSWKVTFTACDEDRHVILQHVLLGVNAHINLDLGVAVAALCERESLSPVRADFDRINRILSDVLGTAQAAIDRHSPLLKILDEVGGRSDEQLITFNITTARAEAWDHAVLLHALGPAMDARAIDILDRKVAFLGKLIRDPGPLLRTALELVRRTESTDISAVIEDLAGAPVPTLG